MGAYKVFLSPSDQTKNTYAACGTNEAVQCGRIALVAKAALERCGMEVMLVQYETMSSKCAKSDAFGADLHVPIHSNAYNGKVGGTRLFYSSTASEGYRACQTMLSVLGALTPGTSDKISAYPSLYEVRVPSAPTLYIEVDFHDVPEIAQWIIDSTALIGEAICEGICKHFGVEYTAPPEEKKEEREMAVRYKTIDDVPGWAKAETQELIDAGALKGKGGDAGLDVTEDMLRTMIINLRYTKQALGKA